ncbi:uncharacterized protein LOC119078705 [Bradysia coprophila]|uniref:uncharacterized protein LOC119078705 n=1 Tax=Bradysia coprophila TaxID=38358 RepID=UPI00187DC72A|nr:uncharacterized protein LOC119078705 [Bradysia coprophila]
MDLNARLQFIAAFEEDPVELTMESSIFESYVPRMLGSCSTLVKMPGNPLDVKAFKGSVKIPGRAPFFRQPKLPQRVPAVSKPRMIVEPKYPSLTPILMTAHFSGINLRLYHVVSQRNSLRKLAMNDEDFVVNVVRFGSTLYLRRFLHYRTTDRNNIGFRFEEMCTGSRENFDFNQLIDGRIGGYKILMMGKVETIRKGSGESIELKCQKHRANMADKVDWWLQAYLIGTKTIIHGRRTDSDETIVSSIEEYDRETMLGRPQKNLLFNRLHGVLKFLFSNVTSDRTFMLRGYKDERGQRRMRLFEVIDSVDKQKLEFMTKTLIGTFTVDG